MNYNLTSCLTESYKGFWIVCIGGSIVLLLISLSAIGVGTIHLLNNNRELTDLLLFQNEMLMYSVEKLNMTMEEFNEDFLRNKFEDILSGSNS